MNLKPAATAVLSYLVRVGDATSQLLNIMVFLGDNPNESVSGRCYRLRQHFFWGKLKVVVDTLASPFEEDHCRVAYDGDLRRARLLVERHGDGSS